MSGMCSGSGSPVLCQQSCNGDEEYGSNPLLDVDC
jgi:hypothetical protein